MKETDCNTKYGVYKLNCKTLEEQYVYQNSNPLRIRMTGLLLIDSQRKTRKPYNNPC